MSDDRDKPKRPHRFGEDPRDVIGDRTPPPVRRSTPAYGYPFPTRNRDERVPKHETPELAAPHEVDEDITGAHPLMSAEQVAELEEKNSYRRIKRMSEQNALLFKMNLEQSRVILDIAKSKSNVETKGLEAQIRVAERRAVSVIDDQVESHKWFRSTASQLIAGVLSGGGIVALLHRLGGC